VTVTAVTADTSQFGGRSLTAQPDKGNKATLAPVVGSTTQWTGTPVLGPLPLGTRNLTVTCACTDAPQLTTNAIIQVTAFDNEAPEQVTVTEPAASAAVVVDASMTVNVKGTAQDANSGMAGGNAQVAVALSPTGTRTTAAPVSGNDWSTWTATITVPGYGSYTLYVWATDAAGNPTPPLTTWTFPFETISSYVPGSLDDRLSDLEYLWALMQFTRDHVSDKTTGGAVSSTMIANALGQPLDIIAATVPGTPTADAAQTPINELRIPAEILRSYIAANNISATPDGAAQEAAYLSAAYQALLSGIGTSHTELSLARGADSTARETLAGRLGISLHGASSAQPRPDQLDALTLDGPARTETALETLFGLPATTAGLDPLRTTPPPQMRTWQITAQQSRWQSEDKKPPSPVAYTVIVDPDILTIHDLQPTAPAQLATQVTNLLTDRAKGLNDHASNLETALANAKTATAQLTALLQAGLPGTDIATLQTQDVQGVDISGQLAAAGLDRNSFAYLVQLQNTASAGLVNDTDWAAAVDVLVGAFRRCQYPTWAQVEAQQQTPIVLSPDNFQLTDTGPAVSTYRIDPRARADWQATLRTRTIARQALYDSTDSLVTSAEQACLAMLRDALILDIAAAKYGGDTDIATTQLTNQYQVDFAASGSLPTTRLAQATATLQSLLLLIRSGDNTSVTGSAINGWSLTKNDEAGFDTAWAWMGTAESWQSATTTFLFAEAALDPFLLQETPQDSSPSPEFQQLCQDLAVIGPPDSTAISDYLTAATTRLQNLTILGANDKLSYLSGQAPTQQLQLKGWCEGLSKSKYPGLACEIFWGVPMLVGQRLHAAGYYQDALDWLWVVYPYNATAPVSSFDVINTELATPTSQAVPADLTFKSEWTADLNPFDLIQQDGHATYPYRPYSWMRNTLLAIITCLIDYADNEYAAATNESISHARNLYTTAKRLLNDPRLIAIKPSSQGEPALAVPQLAILATRVTTQLTKLEQGRDIAGLPRTQVVTTGNPISQPTPYHFKVLLARAQQLTQQATTIEAEYLSALEKYDSKTLQVSDAQNGANVASLQLTVSKDQVKEAKDAVKAATAQQSKATAMSNQYQEAINAPPNQYEQDLLNQYPSMRDTQDVIAGADAAIGIAQAAQSWNVATSVLSLGVSPAATASAIVGYGVKAGAQVWLNNLQAQVQADQLQAGIADRQQEWAIQQASANQDAVVAAAQVKTANAQQTIAEAQQAVADTQNRQAKATLKLLTTQFTNPDLYKWMSDTLGGVYRYFLQQATATAQLAQAQLAFERAEPEQAFMRASYWQPPAQLAASAQKDTRGMTGAEQLAEDLSQLDQYAFSTDTRRLNLSQTFSLAQLMPVEFLAFRTSGQITFATPMQWFDQDFPGHYQRLIRQVSVSVVALVPPTRGIRATLSSSGISRVIAANDGTFSEVMLRRDPPTIAFTAPINATGVFQIDLQPDLLLPFEGSGVDTMWEFTMPPAANPIDFSGVSDVLITLDYTALADPDYQAQMIRQLNANQTRNSDRVFSFAQDFPDQWYALNNPAPASATRQTALTLSNADFPPGISPDSLTTTQIAIQLSASSLLTPVPVTLSHGTASGTATTDSGGVASTRRAADAWKPLTLADGNTTSPTGDWTLSFDASADSLFQQGVLNDLLLIISWTGQAPAWPT
jgi:hypothetical protein